MSTHVNSTTDACIKSLFSCHFAYMHVRHPTVQEDIFPPDKKLEDVYHEANGDQKNTSSHLLLLTGRPLEPMTILFDLITGRLSAEDHKLS